MRTFGDKGQDPLNVKHLQISMRAGMLETRACLKNVLEERECAFKRRTLSFHSSQYCLNLSVLEGLAGQAAIRTLVGLSLSLKVFVMWKTHCSQEDSHRNGLVSCFGLQQMDTRTQNHI